MSCAVILYGLYALFSDLCRLTDCAGSYHIGIMCISGIASFYNGRVTEGSDYGNSKY